MADDRNDEAPTGLKRRDALKILGGAPALAAFAAQSAQAQNAAPRPFVPAARPGSTPASTGPYTPRALDAHEYQMLTVLSDLIIPADAHSGSATDAGVPACVDDFLTIRGDLLLDQIRGGFLWLDLESRRLHGRDFVDSTRTQQQALLDRIAWPERAAEEDRNAVAFFNHLRDLVANAFYSSEVGVKDLQYVGNVPVAHWVGCPDNVLDKLNLSYAGSQWRVPFPKSSSS